MDNHWWECFLYKKNYNTNFISNIKEVLKDLFKDKIQDIIITKFYDQLRSRHDKNNNYRSRSYNKNAKSTYGLIGIEISRGTNSDFEP